MAAYLFSAFYRNGEDLVFFEQDFHDLAYAIATGPHQYDFSISNLGWHLTFTTPAYVLEVTYETISKGSAKITLKGNR